jgi:hypothetical protein
LASSGRASFHLGAAAEAEEPDRVALFIVGAEEAVGIEDIVVEAVTGRETEELANALLDQLPAVVVAHRADARTVIDELVVGLLQDSIELKNIRELVVDLVTSAVAADDRYPCSTPILAHPSPLVLITRSWGTP